MTIKDIQARLDEIKSHGNEENYEESHPLEDQLYIDFIEWVASLKMGDISKKANRILMARRFGFTRWYS